MTKRYQWGNQKPSRDKDRQYYDQKIKTDNNMKRQTIL